MVNLRLDHSEGLMSDNELSRFLDAQEQEYPTALKEIRNGRKTSHWMWYIFPQLQGLGRSHYAHFYGLSGSREAQAFLQHPVLGKRLVEACEALLALESTSAYQVMGSPDDLKLRSSMTLFAVLPDTDAVFEKVLQKFFEGKKDLRTLELLKIQES